ncbi:hypothetical protein VE04_01755 [Pseudogymnoascus sp. 24MN13]|nr:hypothetical protein VE04_01755 [Pseudogymnoascus sp. 24MN13]
MPSILTAREWRDTFSGPFIGTKGGSRTQCRPAQKEDSDILATCQTPDVLTMYWQARYVALVPETDLVVHVIEGTKKPQRSHKTNPKQCT